MERGHKYRSGVTRKMGARWESGPLQPWEQLVVAVSPYNPETRNRAFGPALRNQYPSTEKRISVQRNSRDKRTWLDRNARQAWAEGVCILCLRSKLVEAGW